MQNKLQELTDRLYNEGLSKGKQDGETLVANAKAEAANLIKEAKAEAERIIANAQKEAEDIKTKVTADVKMAATQSMTATKQEMENMVVSKAVANATSQMLNNEEFLKELIRNVVSAFNPKNAEPMDLEFVLPESIKNNIEPFINNEIAKQFNSEVSVSYSKKVNAGFKVAPKNGGYTLQFTDTEFTELISSYLRPATKKILFG
ncbi:MAG: hypothetical protein MJZ76_05460 [Bacteroidales bacterium]|nr:hypothetical protein [Bacteroidales bacterium]